MDSVCAIVVSYKDHTATRQAAASLRGQTHPPREIIVVDNDDSAALGDVDGAHVMRMLENVGYAAGANAGASAAGDVSWLFFLNPDAVATPDCLERLLGAAHERTALLGAQVLLNDGERVNAGDNPVHLTGLSWSGRFELTRESGSPRDVAAVSGAALLVRRAAWEELGGLTERFFLYHDDVDLAWRARLRGWTVRFVPEATVRHDYAFGKGREKWMYLERNRAWSVLTLYSVRTLLLLAPLLLATEAAILVTAARQGWLREKLRAWLAIARWVPAVRARRAELQRSRGVPDAAVLALHTATVDSPILLGPLLTRVNPWMERYHAFVLRVVR